MAERDPRGRRKSKRKTNSTQLSPQSPPFKRMRRCFFLKESVLLFKRILRGQRSEAHARIIPRPPVALGVIPRVPRLRVLLWGTAFCFNYFFL